jgi:hypothetical protein
VLGQFGSKHPTLVHEGADTCVSFKPAANDPALGAASIKATNS